MRLTTKGRFAVTAMVDLALQHGSGPVTLAEISARQRISLSYLEQLFGKLRRHNLVESVRGPGGGYCLAKDLGEVTVSEIILAVDEPIDATQCGGKENCRDDQKCLTHDLWAALNQRIFDYLGSVTLQQMVEQQKAKESARDAGVAQMHDMRDPGKRGSNVGLRLGSLPVMEHVYFDHNATTPVDERVLAAMLPFLRGQYGNASSRHEFGTLARRAVDAAREQVAGLVNVRPSQVIFVSGGTEANNAFIKGAASYLNPSQVAVSAIEHPCVAKPAQELARAGWKVRKLAVTRDGALDTNDLDAALREPTGLVSVMLANNETGVMQNVAAAGERARRAKAWMHTDAVQALGKIPVDFPALNVHAMTLSAHKIYGPKGAGALVVDRRLELRPLIHGGGHEQGLRSGTENVPAIVGFGAACELAAGRMNELAPYLKSLRARLEQGLGGMGAVIFGAGASRIPNTSYFAFDRIEGETLVIELDKAGYAVAPGAACSSANPEPSATLLAMGVEPEFARGAVRFSLGAGNTAEQIDGFLKAVAAVIARLRGLTAMVA